MPPKQHDSYHSVSKIKTEWTRWFWDDKLYYKTVTGKHTVTNAPTEGERNRRS